MPAYPILRFVNSIAASPTIDLDLHNENPFTVDADDFSIGAPTLTADPLSIGVKWGYRTLTLSPKVWGSNTVALAAYQALAKQVTQDNLLMLQWDGDSPPVFFKTYKTQPGELDMSNVFTAEGVSFYKLTVTLTADHAAYGLPETNTFTISNDPASGANKCFYQWPVPVKGDLPTPLYLEAATSDVRGQNRLLASQALLGATQTGPVVVQANTLTHNVAGIVGTGAPVGTLVDNTGDTAMSGGNYTRYTSSISDGPGTALLYGSNLLAPLVGDYRIFMRGRASHVSDGWSFNIVQLSGTSVSYATYAGVTAVCNGPTVGPHWFDMQSIFRFPYGAPPVDPIGVFDTAYTSPGLSFAIVLQGRGASAHTFDIDCLLFIPVGLDQAVETRYSTTAFDKSGQLTTAKVAWNGASDTRYLIDGSGNYSPSIAPKAEGGLPTLVPGMDNSIHYLQHVGTGYNDPRTGVTTGTNDVLTNSTVLTWKYWPRYAWLRSGAAT
jgi:hypothetical protein